MDNVIPTQTELDMTGIVNGNKSISELDEILRDFYTVNTQGYSESFGRAILHDIIRIVSKQKDILHNWQSTQSDAVEGNDFLLWVVVNRWSYDYETHKWYNVYIREVSGLLLSYSKLLQLFKNNGDRRFSIQNKQQ